MKRIIKILSLFMTIAIISNFKTNMVWAGDYTATITLKLAEEGKIYEKGDLIPVDVYLNISDGDLVSTGELYFDIDREALLYLAENGDSSHQLSDGGTYNFQTDTTKTNYPRLGWSSSNLTGEVWFDRVYFEVITETPGYYTIGLDRTSLEIPSNQYPTYLSNVSINFTNFHVTETKFELTAVPCTVQVGDELPASVENISLSVSSLAMAVGEISSLTATITPEEAANKNVTWSSDNTSVATVDESGTVTAVAAGTANITVTTEDGGKTATCAVTVTEPVAAGYTVGVSSVSQEIKAGQPATVGLNLGVGTDSTVNTYNAVDMTITYDSSKLTYDEDTSSYMEGAEVDASEAGTIHITRYGSELAIPADPFVTLGFTSSENAEGTAEVTVTSAKVDLAENASQDAQEATITNPTHTITFTVPQTYAVTLEGDDVTGDATATEGLPYTFTVNKEDGYDYTVTVTKEDGTEITPSVDGSTYTVAAADITGPFTVSVTKTKIPESYDVTTDAGETGLDIGGGATATAGEDYTFTIAGFDPDQHELTVTDADGNPVEYVRNADGSFTVKGENIKSALRLSVTAKAAEPTLSVEAFEYLKLDGKSLWLLVANDTFTDDNNVLAYSGAVMYHSSAYDGFCWLVESAEGKDAVEEAAKTAIAQTAGTAAEILYDNDVNRTGLVDINDAQMTYNMYNAYYDGIGEATMQMFLEADVSGDKTVDSQDAVIIVAAVK